MPGRRPCIGDLRDRVTLLKRESVPPAQGETNVTHAFTSLAKVWCKITTPKDGTTFFDGVNSDILVSHVLEIRHRTDVDSETWVELPRGSRVRVLQHKDVGERQEFLRLTCTERGASDVSAARS